MRIATLGLGLLLALGAATPALASTNFDVDAATQAYLAMLSPEQKARSDAYFEGGYWLILWGALIGVAVDWFLLQSRLSHRFRTTAERITARTSLVPGLTAIPYVLAGWILTLPWTIYTGYFREKQYDLLDQSFGAWFSEGLIALVISLITMPLLFMAIYAVIRRAPKTWWLWGTGVVGAFLAIGLLIAPVYIAPLFNEYTEMEQGPLRDSIEEMAAKYDVPAEHIYVFDQSRQHSRISANVSGIGPTIRISLNDNLLNRTTEPEIKAVMGHELGHYVIGHVMVIFGVMLALVAIGFFALSRIAPRLIARYGTSWGVRDLADPASLPVLGLLLTVYATLLTPVTNSLIRINESQADAFGLDAAEEPDGFARAAMRLSEYRKISPGPIEEFLFFDHPSGETRVRMAMEWKKAHVANPQIVTPPPLEPKD